MKKKEKDKTMSIRLSSKDVEIIRKNMSKFNLENMSFYMRTVAINPSIINVDIKTLRDLTYEINKVGININQAVKLANKNKEISREEINALKEDLEKIQSLKVVTTFLKEKSIYGSN